MAQVVEPGVSCADAVRSRGTIKPPNALKMHKLLSMDTVNENVPIRPRAIVQKFWLTKSRTVERNGKGSWRNTAYVARNTTKLALAEQTLEDETRVQNATERSRALVPAPKHCGAFTFSGSGVTWMRSTNTDRWQTSYCFPRRSKRLSAVIAQRKCRIELGWLNLYIYFHRCRIKK